MKALLLKDIYVLFRQLKLQMIILILFSILPGLSVSALAMLYVVMLPVTTLGYDERSKWDQLAVMMPYTPQQLVCSKYFLGYLGAGLVAVLSFLTQIISCIVTNTPVSASTLAIPLLVPCMGLLLLALNLPFMFRFGTEKGRLLYILTVGILSGIAAIPQAGLTTAFSDVSSLLLLVLVAVTVLLNLLSAKLSIKFYLKRQ